jgi:hypothetical protein
LTPVTMPAQIGGRRPGTWLPWMGGGDACAAATRALARSGERRPERPLYPKCGYFAQRRDDIGDACVAATRHEGSPDDYPPKTTTVDLD